MLGKYVFKVNEKQMSSYCIKLGINQNEMKMSFPSYLLLPFRLPRTWIRRWGSGDPAATFESWSGVVQCAWNGEQDLKEMGTLDNWRDLGGAFVEAAGVELWSGGPGPPSGGAAPSVGLGRGPGPFSKHGFCGRAGLAPVLGRITIPGSEI